MRWLADECVDASLVTRLREAGYDTVYLAQAAPSAMDADIVALARREGRLLLTEEAILQLANPPLRLVVTKVLI